MGLGLALGLGLGQILGVVEGVHSLALLPCLLLHWGRMGLMGLVWWTRGVSLALLPSGWA